MLRVEDPVALVGVKTQTAACVHRGADQAVGVDLLAVAVLPAFAGRLSL